MKTLVRTLRYMGPYWHLQAVALVCALVVAANAFVWPWVTKLLVDDFFMAAAGSPQHQRAVLYLASGLGVGSALVGTLFGLARTYLFARVGERAVADLRRELFRHLHLLPMRFFDARKTGGIMSIVQNDVEIQIDVVTVALDFKYVFEQCGRFRPYVVGGPAIYVLGHEPDNQFVAGIAPLPPELSQHDYPSGNADTEWGVNLGLGCDVELTELLHVGFDGRYNFVTDANNQFVTLGGYLALAF